MNNKDVCMCGVDSRQPFLERRFFEKKLIEVLRILFGSKTPRGIVKALLRYRMNENFQITGEFKNLLDNLPVEFSIALST